MSDGLGKRIITIGEVIIDNAQVEKVLDYTVAAVATGVVATGAYMAHKVLTDKDAAKNIDKAFGSAKKKYK